MCNTRSAGQATAVAAALAELDVRSGERVLIMLPDGPGFAEAFAGTIKHGAVPLPVNPLLFAHDILAAAAESGARLLLASADQIQTLTTLGTKPPILIDKPQEPWAALLRLCTRPTNHHQLTPHHPPHASEWCCYRTPNPTDTQAHQRRTREGPPA